MYGRSAQGNQAIAMAFLILFAIVGVGMGAYLMGKSTGKAGAALEMNESQLKGGAQRVSSIVNQSTVKAEEYVASLE